MTISEHATASIHAPDLIGNMSQADQRKHLSELVRIAERSWARAEDNASRLEEGRSIIMSEMKLNLVSEALAKSMSQAEDIVRSSDKFKAYVCKMHDARREANDTRAEWRKLLRDYFDAVNDEKGELQQMRMSRQ
jgi:hypothetical protein